MKCDRHSSYMYTSSVKIRLLFKNYFRTWVDLKKNRGFKQFNKQLPYKSNIKVFFFAFIILNSAAFSVEKLLKWVTKFSNLNELFAKIQHILLIRQRTITLKSYNNLMAFKIKNKKSRAILIKIRKRPIKKKFVNICSNLFLYITC